MQNAIATKIVERPIPFYFERICDGVVFWLSVPKSFVHGCQKTVARRIDVQCNLKEVE